MGAASKVYLGFFGGRLLGRKGLLKGCRKVWVLGVWRCFFGSRGFRGGVCMGVRLLD